ncbi:hypothetical protein N657DRAFT_650018 [Parathielavia appendiculata]|uniref:Uncharacterized protein n=1 Tax=Parathielavia appendiculata TaxID=2587402 RepID=A0AAN6TRY4_9PEZI|nr:hypothetical protein N657DRAFT_650018 [Parathielavia appendiculata]
MALLSGLPWSFAVSTDTRPPRPSVMATGEEAVDIHAHVGHLVSFGELGSVQAQGAEEARVFHVMNIARQNPQGPILQTNHTPCGM